MQNVAVVTDSAACLPGELVQQYGIGIVPIRLLVGGKIYRDSVDITPSRAYELFLQDPKHFNTSPSSPGHYIEIFREASKRAKDILCVTLSTKLSGGYNAALIARVQAAAELPLTSIAVFDSRTVTAAEGFVALAAARAASAGKDLSQVTGIAKTVRDRVTFMILVDTLRYVYRTGRIPKIAALAGSMLNIRPILTSSSGSIRLKAVARNREQGIDRLLKEMSDKVGKNRIHAGIMHAYAPDEAQKLKEQVSSRFHCIELWGSEFSPVMGYAVGTGSLGMAFYSE